MSRTIRLPQIQNVAPNQRASLRLPLGVTYQKIYLQLGTNITTSLMSNIVLRINNKEFQRWATAADLFTGLNAYKGNLTATNYLCIDFTERLARDEIGLSLGTVAATNEAGVQELTLEFDLGTYTVVAASIITGWADVDVPSSNRIIQRVQYAQKVIAAAAQEQIFVPFGANGYLLKRLIFRHVNLSSVRIRRDGTDIYEDLPVAVANQRNQDFGRVPQAGYFVLDLMPDTLQSNAFSTGQLIDGKGESSLVQNLDIRLTTSASDTITYYAEAYSSNAQL